MLAFGKNITYFLMDGDPMGRVKCTMANWTGIAYKIPRTELGHCKERDDLKQSGVYFLFGTDEDTEKERVYIGQANARKNGEGLLLRLLEHTRKTDEDWWYEAIVFTTSNNSLEATEISYLENKLYNLACEANRTIVDNRNEPTSGTVREEKESELNEFIGFVRVLMIVLGHKVLEPLQSKASSPARDEVAVDDVPMLYLVQKEANATGQRTKEGFLVFEKSAIASAIQNSCPRGIVKLRENSKESIDDHHSLRKDMLFTSPSAAAAFVLGTSASGNAKWKDKEGKPLGDLDKNK